MFQHGLKSQPLTEDDWSDLLTPDILPAADPIDFDMSKGELLVELLLSQGETVQYVREQEYAEVIKTQGFDLEFEGVKFLACNSHELDIRSHLFAAGIQTHHEALLGFTYAGPAKGWRVSMYHAPGKEDRDLSLIAVKHGGGGHRGACGFRTKELPFAL